MAFRRNPSLPPSSVITLDGGAASGKSSVSSRLAARLGVPYISTGLFYRAVTAAALEQHLNLSDEAVMAALLEQHTLTLELLGGENQVLWDDLDLTAKLHTSEIDAHVSEVSKHPAVREWVKKTLRTLEPPFVAEGRDMGRVVFPEARFKFYLVASPRVRAQRRAGERPEDVAQIEAALLERDLLDTEQSRAADDATQIDTSSLTLEQVVEHIVSEIEKGEIEKTALEGQLENVGEEV
jgi:CMP/dCMP kinase